MNVLLVANRFFPDPPAGTEIHVAALYRHLDMLGVHVSVAAPDSTVSDPKFLDDDGMEVIRYPISASAERRNRINESDQEQVRLFARLLEEHSVDILHLHAWDRLVGAQEALAANNLGMPVFLTLHHPLVVCPRGSALQWGANPCPVPADFRVCAACVLQSRGIPLPLAHLLSFSPLHLSFDRIDSRVGKAITLAPRQIAIQHRKQALWSQLAAFIVPSKWIGRMLSLYDVPPKKVHHIPQPLCQPLPKDWMPTNRLPSVDGCLTVGSLGRCKPLKGFGLLIKAVKSLPEGFPLRVVVHCIGGTEAETKHLSELKALAGTDRMIEFGPPLEPTEVLPTIAQWDGVIVPSLVQECAPLVVLEAFAAGVPVIGSDCGGIAEFVTHNENGLLFKTGSVSSLVAQLCRFCQEPGLRVKLRRRIPPVPNNADMANRVYDIYQSLGIAS
jgi:glycosyltransferase involved in cell wall biosynthesis